MKYLFAAILVLLPASASASIIISEVAWMGNENSHADEWIEIKNTGSETVNLDGWTLKAADGSPKIQAAGNVPAGGFYLLERSKNYTGALENSGEILELYDGAGNLIDKIDASSGWPAGDNKTKQTMERSSSALGADSWQTSQSPGGTPMAENSKLSKFAETDSPQISPVSGVSPNSTEPSLNLARSSSTDTIELHKQSSPSPLLFAAVFTSFSGGVMILLLKRKINVGT